MGITARDVTVIVPTRGRKDRVGALLSQLRHPHDRVMVVIDDGRESEDLPSCLNGQILIRCKPDAGSVGALEAGIMAANTSHVLLLNDDVVSLSPIAWRRRFGSTMSNSPMLMALWAWTTARNGRISPALP